MSTLALEDVHVRYPGAQTPVLRGLSLSLPLGGIACLLGPSGCGKSTALRAIAGFEPLSAGRIALDGRTLSTASAQIAPEHRGVGLLFQEIALFPHLDAAANVGFGLRRWKRDERVRRVRELLAVVGLDALGGRMPHELSGGQQQRVALARALAPSPKLLLLDEPFSSLDADTRGRLVREVRAILRDAGQTALMVTHDPEEAEAMADWIGVMGEGTLAEWRAGRWQEPEDPHPCPLPQAGEGVTSAQASSLNGRWPMADS
ncbi:MAG: ABC transporter ATP-binding protein [Mitsuaria chitosanitabida]|uniref:ABC transporter ATP-binding protein n=1 Tax=Roseateles chitosanitabidus TaxID=65048 RepID=UPI001B09F238|nr:ABC transporter ATP-binding protein [Roseateles chitosanitabidus]MBO9685979.1 ABC transporter ATP-binding protein [Roseateles chitosanitabidus]